MKTIALKIVVVFLLIIGIFSFIPSANAEPDAKGRWVLDHLEPCPDDPDNYVIFRRCEPHYMIQCTGLWSWWIDTSACDSED